MAGCVCGHLCNSVSAPILCHLSSPHFIHVILEEPILSLHHYALLVIAD